MRPRHMTGFQPSATDKQITELEQHCKHILPENYKTILKNYNGGRYEVRYLDVIDAEGIHEEWQVGMFFTLDGNKTSPINIWWYIERYDEYLGPNIVPFADDGEEQIYYIKWKYNIPQIWCAYLGPEDPENFFVAASFDEFLEALYS